MNKDTPTPTRAIPLGPVKDGALNKNRSAAGIWPPTTLLTAGLERLI